MPVTKQPNGATIITPARNLNTLDGQISGSTRDRDFSVTEYLDASIQLQVDLSPALPGGVAILKAPAGLSTTVILTLPSTSGTIAISGGGSSTPSFVTIQTPAGTSPVATGTQDVLTYVASNGISITGNATTDTVTFAGVAADGSTTGVVTTTTQTFSGEKTFTAQIDAPAVLLNGSDTLKSVGTHNIAFGSTNFSGSVTGNNNVALGTEALAGLASGSLNVGIGEMALNILSGGVANTAIGYNAGAAGIVNHSDNTLVGSLTGYNTNGSGNTGVGASAMFGGATAAGDHNSAFGAVALTALTSGANNVAIGYSALAAVTSGSGNVAIGNQADVPTATANNQLSIANFIYGTGMDGTGATISAGKVGLGVKAPISTLDVAGDISISAVGNGLAVKTGSNAKVGTATLSGGSATVSNTAVTANSRIFVTSNADGGVPGWLRVSAITPATNFVITSSSVTDTSTVAWIIIESLP